MVASFLIFAMTASAGDIYVPDDYLTIQAAIDVAWPGDTIHVAAGTYREYLHITTDHLTIIGAGIDQCIIDLDGLTPYWHYTGSSYASRAGVLISGYGSPDQIVEDVTFRGFTVKNAGLNPPISATGTHTGSDDVATLTDSTKAWIPGALVGEWIHNYGDRDTDYNPARSYGQITANTAMTVTATLSGGKENDWDNGDQYLITPYKEFYNTYWIHTPNYDGLRGFGIGNGKNILIQDCKITDSGYGGITTGYARSVSTHKYSEYITIDNCIIKDHPHGGINIGNNVGSFTVTNNVCENIGQPHYYDPTREYMGYGIQVSGTKKYGMASGVISGNICSDNGFIGINLTKYTDGIIVEDNEVTGHNSDQDGAGIFMYHWGHPEWCKNHIVRNNTVTGNIRGIVAYYVQDCTIEGNTITTDSGEFDDGQGAIKLDNAKGTEVKDNTISCDGTGVTVQSYDSIHNSSGNIFTGNIIRGAKFAGVLIYGPFAQDNTFTGNTITGTTSLTLWAGSVWEETQADGVFIDDDAGTGNVFHQNNIYNNDGDGMEDQVSWADATCNWWGHYTGPNGLGTGIGDAVYGVSFDPWLALPFGSEFEVEKAKIEFKDKANDDKAQVKGHLGNVCGSGVTISDEVTVTVGSLPFTIPGGEMKEKGKEGEKWEYKRPKGNTGEIKGMKIDWKNGKFDIHMDKVDLSGLTNPNTVTISITIGVYDFGSQEIEMTVKKNKWEYKK
jgi:parallel beta-helix repeat protein